MLLYRPLVDGDIPAGLALCRAAGWNQTREDWELFLSLGRRAGVVAVDEDGEVRGTAATIRYEDHFCWIGMVLVDPSRRGEGIGRRLLEEALELVADVATVKLDATPAGRKIYVKLGFTDEYPISRMELGAIPFERLPESRARPLAQEDMFSVTDFDRDVFGANRSGLLKAIVKRTSDYSFVYYQGDEIRAYCLGRLGYRFTHIGPVVATDFESARHVVSAALRNCQGMPVIIDALHHATEWRAWLSELGFVEQRPLIRMYRGENRWPGLPQKQFAILGPEFG